MSVGADQAVSGIRADAFLVPTATAGRERPESDGTIEWGSTGVVVVRLSAGGETGLGYAYAAPAALGVVRDTLWEVVRGTDAGSKSPSRATTGRGCACSAIGFPRRSVSRRASTATSRRTSATS